MDFTTLERVTPNSYWRCKIKRQCFWGRYSKKRYYHFNWWYKSWIRNSNTKCN